MIHNPLNFAGEVAIVTGGGRSIGRAISEGLAAAGAKVVVNYSTDSTAADEAVDAIRRNGGEAISVQADISKEAEVGNLIGATTSNFGTVSLLVNNAAVLSRNKLLDIELSEWERTLEVNLTGAFLTSQHAAREMIENQRGSIVNITSINQSRAREGLTHYSTSKAGLTMLTRQLALELAQSGIRANAVALGMFETDMNRVRLADDSVRSEYESLIPLGHIGKPEDAVGPVLFLLSEYARLITGSTLVVDAGRSLT